MESTTKSVTLSEGTWNYLESCAADLNLSVSDYLERCMDYIIEACPEFHVD